MIFVFPAVQLICISLYTSKERTWYWGFGLCHHHNDCTREGEDITKDKTAAGRVPRPSGTIGRVRRQQSPFAVPGSPHADEKLSVSDVSV